MFSNIKFTMLEYKHKITGEEVENCQLTDIAQLNLIKLKSQ